MKQKRHDNKIGQTTTLIGLILNIILAIGKIITGLLFSIGSVTADGMNNLGDSIVSIVTLISFRLTNKKPDRLHPFGYERVEYILSLAIGIIIIVFGVQIINDGINAIINPTTLLLNAFVFTFLGISIVVKTFLFFYYRYVAKKINSMEIKALSKDSFNDIISNLAIIVSLILFATIKINIDGYLSSIVGLLVIWSGIQVTRKAITPLIGVIPDKKRIETIIEEIRKFPQVLGTHDVIVHSYGLKKEFMSIHIEVNDKMTLLEAHEVADEIETEIKSEHNIELVTHIDPIEQDNPEYNSIQDSILKIIKKDLDSPKFQFHELRLIKPFVKTRRVVFELTVPVETKLTYKEIQEILQKAIRELNIEAVINLEDNYLE